jgi:hypothetical protein
VPVQEVPTVLKQGCSLDAASVTPGAHRANWSGSATNFAQDAIDLMQLVCFIAADTENDF